MRDALKIVSIFSFLLLLHACTNKCKKYSITDTESSLIHFEAGRKYIFQNNLNSLYDTLVSHDRQEQMYCSDCSCDDIVLGISTYHMLRHDTLVDVITAGIKHEQELKLNDEFVISTTPQQMTVNGITYYDVYCSKIDTLKTTLAPSEAWQVEYSSSQGFIRLYYLGGKVLSRIK